MAISNNVASRCGAVCMLDNCTVNNVNSLYFGNIVTHSDAAAVYGKRWCDITNVETTFEENTGIYGIIILQDHGFLVNNASIFR